MGNLVMPACSFKEGDTIWSVDRWRNAYEGHYETVKTVGRLYICTEGGVKYAKKFGVGNSAISTVKTT